MSYQINLDAIDVDGAVREAHAEAVDGLESGDTRMGFLRKAGLAGGAVVGIGALAPEAALAKLIPRIGNGRPPSSFGKGDIGILNYALTLEYLERAFYNEATANGKITDPETVQFLQVVTRDERAHVAALRSALGAKAVRIPKFNFQGTTSDQTMFQQTAFVLENTGVHAYSGQATNIANRAYVRVAVSILTIEARHAAVIGRIIKGGPGIAPNGAFDTAYTATKVLNAVKGTHFIV